MSKSAYLYILHAVGSDWYKIGVTSREVKDRINAMQTGNPYRIEEFGAVRMDERRAYKMEAMCHDAFAEVRGTGEWFTLAPETAQDLLCALQYEHDIHSAVLVAVRATGLPVFVVPYTPPKGEVGSFMAFIDAAVPKPHLDALVEFQNECARAMREAGARYQLLSPEEAVGLLLRVWRESMSDDLSALLRGFVEDDPYNVDPIYNTIRVMGLVAKNDYHKMDAARRLMPTEPDLDGMVTVAEGPCAVTCPECGSTDLKDKGSFDKCGGCGHRISYGVDA